MGIAHTEKNPFAIAQQMETKMSTCSHRAARVVGGLITLASPIGTLSFAIAQQQQTDKSKQPVVSLHRQVHVVTEKRM